MIMGETGRNDPEKSFCSKTTEGRNQIFFMQMLLLRVVSRMMLISGATDFTNQNADTRYFRSVIGSLCFYCTNAVIRSVFFIMMQSRENHVKICWNKSMVPEGSMAIRNVR